VAIRTEPNFMLTLCSNRAEAQAEQKLKQRQKLKHSRNVGLKNSLFFSLLAGNSVLESDDDRVDDRVAVKD
jgi:hypothetical protein